MTEFTEADGERVESAIELIRDAQTELDEMAGRMEQVLEDGPETVEEYEERIDDAILDVSEMHLDKYDEPAIDKVCKGEYR